MIGMRTVAALCDFSSRPSSVLCGRPGPRRREMMFRFPYLDSVRVNSVSLFESALRNFSNRSR